MYAIKYNIKINWTQIIMQQMWHILEHFGISLVGETKVALNLHESKIDIEVVHKMGLTLYPVTCRTYKHRTDRPTALTEQPKPTIPDQPESQAPSTSSAAMPSNQMSMDELVSLRGYITTRTNAIDTENQQIHYELHRLSSRHIPPKERGSIQDRGAILKTSQEKLSSMLLSENYTFKKILVFHHQKGGDCEEDLAPNLGM
ncbi:hypothetical protein Lal_00015602 [Lupinus albus]|nr:hypothetical protein Lal_00015602 [Lupinus albus]